MTSTSPCTSRREGLARLLASAGILKACEGRSKRIGACLDLGYWMRSGLDPIQGVGS